MSGDAGTASVWLFFIGHLVLEGAITRTRQIGNGAAKQPRGKRILSKSRHFSRIHAAQRYPPAEPRRPATYGWKPGRGRRKACDTFRGSETRDRRLFCWRLRGHLKEGNVVVSFPASGRYGLPSRARETHGTTTEVRGLPLTSQRVGDNRDLHAVPPRRASDLRKAPTTGYLRAETGRREPKAYETSHGKRNTRTGAYFFQGVRREMPVELRTCCF